MRRTHKKKDFVGAKPFGFGEAKNLSPRQRLRANNYWLRRNWRFGLRQSWFWLAPKLTLSPLRWEAAQ